MLEGLFLAWLFLTFHFKMFIFVTPKTYVFNLMRGRSCLFGYHIFLGFVELFNACKIPIIVLNRINNSHLSSFLDIGLLAIRRRVLLRYVFNDLNLLDSKFKRSFLLSFLGTWFDIRFYLVSARRTVEVWVIQGQSAIVKHLNLRDNFGQTLVLIINCYHIGDFCEEVCSCFWLIGSNLSIGLLLSVRFMFCEKHVCKVVHRLNSMVATLQIIKISVWFGAWYDLCCCWRLTSSAFWTKSPARAWSAPAHTHRLI